MLLTAFKYGVKIIMHETLLIVCVFAAMSTDISLLAPLLFTHSMIDI